MTCSSRSRPGAYALAATALAAVSLTLAGCGTAKPPAPHAAATPAKPRPPAAAPAPSNEAAPATPMFGSPGDGAIVKRFDGKGSKGIDLQGTAGAPVNAVGDGQVVLVSNALRAYGTMVIVRHDGQYLSAYAQLGRVLVKEKESVRRGQRIADMGSAPGSAGRLHFELRRNGNAIDPEPYLPRR